LIPRKIIKIVATRCHILRGAHSAPPAPQAGFNGATYKGRGGREREKGKGRGKKGEGRGELRHGF